MRHSNLQRGSGLSARRFLPFLCLALLALAGTAMSADSPPRLDEAVAHYDRGEFEEAIPLFEALCAAEPRNAAYHHWLGKAYGRLAERSNWISAALLARKTLQQFERAVELDGTAVQPLRDLRQFYLRAPAILGGSEEKAAAIGARLQAMGEALD